MDEELLIDFASGALGKAGALLVATQCALRPDARAAFSACETVAGAMLSLAPGATLDVAALARLEARLDAADQEDDRRAAPAPRAMPLDGLETPAPLAAALAASNGGAPWKLVMPGMHERVIGAASDEHGAAKLIRLKAGKSIPEHGHEGREITLVLSGAYEDDQGRFSLGDVSVVDQTVEHRPIVSAERDCVCLSVVEGRLRMRRPVRELVRYLFS